MVPDHRRFGVIFMRRKALEGLRHEGGLRQRRRDPGARSADEQAAIAAVDACSGPMAAPAPTGARTRCRTPSSTASCSQLRAMAFGHPADLPVRLGLPGQHGAVAPDRAGARADRASEGRGLRRRARSAGTTPSSSCDRPRRSGHRERRRRAPRARPDACSTADFYSFPFLVFRQSPDLYVIAGAAVSVRPSPARCGRSGRARALAGRRHARRRRRPATAACFRRGSVVPPAVLAADHHGAAPSRPLAAAHAADDASEPRFPSRCW